MRGSNLRPGLAVATILAMAIPGPALAAQEQVEDHRAANADVKVQIDEIIVGSIVITGWDRNEFELAGTVGADIDDFYVEGGPDRIEVGAGFTDGDRDSDGANRHGRSRTRNHGDANIELQIHVPRGASLQIEGVTASITVSGVDGSIDLESVTGRIEYEGNATRLDLANVTGSMSVQAPRVTRGNFESVNGDIIFAGGLGAHAKLDFENVNGDIELTLLDAVSASFDIETLLGEVVNELGPEARSSSRWVPSKELRFQAGDGDAEINIETLQGSIRLRRQ